MKIGEQSLKQENKDVDCRDLKRCLCTAHDQPHLSFVWVASLDDVQNVSYCFPCTALKALNKNYKKFLFKFPSKKTFDT